MGADNRTEKATPRRQQKARAKGQVARSRELASALAFAAVCGTVAMGASQWPAAWRGFMGAVLHGANGGTSAEAAVFETAKVTALWCAPVAAAALGAALAGSVVQGGFVFAPALVGPKLERLSPV